MPSLFLTEADRESLNRCPDDVEQVDLDTYFQLTSNDLAAIATLHGDANRLGFALQLCCLRYLGFFPNDPQEISPNIVHYVAQQVSLKSDHLPTYAARKSTLYEHQQRILEVLGYRRADEADLKALEIWLLERSLEHNRPKFIFDLACDYLKRERIIRPGVSVLVRMVGHARDTATEEVFKRLEGFLTNDRRTFLDSLLETGGANVSRLAWLQRTPQSNKTSAIVETLDKIAFLHEHAVDKWTLSSVNPNRRKWLARKSAKARVNNLRNQNDASRYPQLAAFAQEALFTFTDALLDMFDARLWELHGQCRLAFRKDRLAATKAINETMRVLRVLGEQYLSNAEKSSPRNIADELSIQEVEQALSAAEHLTRPDNDAYTDYFAKHHRQVQNFSKRLLEVMTFNKSSPDAGLLEGLKLIGDIHDGVRRKLPTTAPTSFVPLVWESEVFGAEGLNWRSYEIAALWALREKLRSGDIYVEYSRRYLQLERYLIPKIEWGEEREDVPKLLGAPLEAETRLAERKKVLQTLATQVDAALHEGSDSLRQENNRIIVSPIVADEDSPSLTELRKRVDERLTNIDITELLIKVDNLTGFSKAFTHLGGVSTRGDSLLTQLYACILAQASNLGFKQMATSSDLPFRTLLWCNRWYLRDDTLDEAVTTLVNYHHSLPLSSLWGGGLLSSSDGQRFPVSGDTRKARALPRYFGYGKGVTNYSWTSDQLSQFGSKVIPSTIRDATYVLDAILDNETDLDIAEHTTDTAGYTELIFGLFGLLGLTFSPRIRDLADQELYRPADFDMDSLTMLKPRLKGVLNETTIAEGWDEMLRVAMSLKKGYCSASLLVSKLQAYPRQHPITRALQEYGKLEKTIHSLRWYADPPTRRRISKQLNKGEALHYLRKAILFGKHGEIPSLEDEALDQQFACLNLVTNAVIVYNTIEITRIVEELRDEGFEVLDKDIGSLWPSRFAHINFLGKYYFDDSLVQQGS